MNSTELQTAIDAIPPMPRSVSGLTRWADVKARTAEIHALELQWREYLEATYATSSSGWKYPQKILDEIYCQALNIEDESYSGIEVEYQRLVEFAGLVAESILSSFEGSGE